MRKMIFVGDAACDSGFARASRAYLDAFRGTFELDVIGLNYRGTPHDWPYRIWPARAGGDDFGIGLLGQLVTQIGPDVVVVLNDPWNVPQYMRHASTVPVAAIMAVDGKNCRGADLNGLAMAVFWTQFGLREARAGGYAGPAAVVPLGVDLRTYQPMDRRAARGRLRLPPDRVPPDAFIVGSVGRNQPRKRLDLTILCFAEWLRTRRVDDAFLYLHVAPTGDYGYDCGQLAAYCGIDSRLILCEPNVWRGPSDEYMRATYSAFDVLLVTSQNEGFHLPSLEAMACGVPCVVPDWAATGEWPGNAALMVPCPTLMCTPNFVNAIGGVPDTAAVIDALDALHRDPALRERLSARGLELVSEPRFRWPAIGDAVLAAVEQGLVRAATPGAAPDTVPGAATAEPVAKEGAA